MVEMVSLKSTNKVMDVASKPALGDHPIVFVLKENCSVTFCRKA
jgi:hypothetical protein